MAFDDVVKVMYNGSMKIDFKVKAHSYYARKRENWELPKDDDKAWGKSWRPKGTTTLIGDTLEKKGLMTWPMGLALRELFGFYDFINEEGKQMTGFSKGKGKGTMWNMFDEATNGSELVYSNQGIVATQDQLLPMIVSASKAWQRKQKKGADIGSVVHDAIEHYIKGQPYNIGEQYMLNIKEYEYETEADREKALKEFDDDVVQATAAFTQFTNWWDKTKPELIGAEDLVYSRDLDICGTFDALLKIDGKLILTDWKSSSASKSRGANAPNGVYYSYFIQSAIYAEAYREMTGTLVDDLMIVSVRKDGEFDIVKAGDVGLFVEECINWAKAVVTCYRYMETAKKALWKIGLDTGRVNDNKGEK